MTWFIAHGAYLCTYLTSCTFVSWKCPLLCILPVISYSWLTEMQILVGRVLETDMESTLKMSYLGCFWFSFCQVYMVNKRRHYGAGRYALHMFHGNYSTVWTIQTFASGNRSFCVHNESQFDHIAVPLGFRSSVHRALNNTATLQFFVFCCPIAYSCGSSLLHDRLKAAIQCSRHSSAHSGRWS